MLRKTSHRAALVAVVGGLAACGAAAYAAIPGGGAINGCYQKNDGQLRVIDAQAGDACRPSERALTWSQTGPQGPAGPQGEQGPAGVSGYETPSAHYLYPAGPSPLDVLYGGIGCPADTKVLGGGGYALWHDLNAHWGVLRASAPFDDGTGWYVRVGMPDGGAFPANSTVDIYVYATCARI